MNNPGRYSLNNLTLAEVLDLLLLVREKAKAEAEGMVLFDDSPKVHAIFKRDHARAAGLENKLYRLFIGADI
jgi:hypothetical protein